MGINHPISQFFMPNLKSEFSLPPPFLLAGPDKDILIICSTGWAKFFSPFPDILPDRKKLQYF
jgi:hypothetical protein